MKERVILLLKVARRHERHRDGIAHRERRGRRARRRESEGTSLAFHTDVNVKIRAAPELGLPPSAHSDDARADAVNDGENIDDLIRLAAVGDGNHDVVRRHHAEIAVKRLGWVHEERGRPRARERRRDLAPHVPGFAHACHDDTRLAL